jgi:hypothetical protein
MDRQPLGTTVDSQHRELAVGSLASIGQWAV